MATTCSGNCQLSTGLLMNANNGVLKTPERSKQTHSLCIIQDLTDKKDIEPKVDEKSSHLLFWIIIKWLQFFSYPSLSFSEAND